MPVHHTADLAGRTSRMSHDAEAIAAVFSRAAPTYDGVIPFFARFGLALVELADLRPGERVLDVGCGRGATLLPAAERVGPSGRVLGVDLADNMVAMLAADLERREVTNAAVRRMDAEALEVPDASFDVAVASFTLHLMPHPERAAAELGRALRRGGRAATAGPVTDDPAWEFVGRLFRSYAPRTVATMPLPLRPDFDLVAVLAAAGLDVLESVEEEIAFVFADEQAWWEWAWSHGMRALLELLPPATLEELRRDVFTELGGRRTVDGLRLRQSARLVIARKPGDGRPGQGM